MLYPLSRLRVAIVVLVLLFTDSPFAHAAQRPATPAEECRQGGRNPGSGHQRAGCTGNPHGLRERPQAFASDRGSGDADGPLVDAEPDLSGAVSYPCSLSAGAPGGRAEPRILSGAHRVPVLESARASGCPHAGAAHVGRDVPGARDLRRHLDHRDGGTLAVEDHDRTPALVPDVQSADRSAHEAARSVHLERRFSWPTCRRRRDAGSSSPLRCPSRVLRRR